MKKLIVPIFYNVLLSLNIYHVQATSIAPEVKRLYAAAQQGNTQDIEHILKWHREQDKKKPATMLQHARALAVEHNDAAAAVALTTRLKQEQMGSWERYFRGITLTATVAVVVGIALVGSKAYGDRKKALRGQLPSGNHDIETIYSDGTPYNPRTELAESLILLPFGRHNKFELY